MSKFYLRKKKPFEGPQDRIKNTVGQLFVSSSQEPNIIIFTSEVIIVKEFARFILQVVNTLPKFIPSQNIENLDLRAMVVMYLM